MESLRFPVWRPLSVTGYFAISHYGVESVPRVPLRIRLAGFQGCLAAARFKESSKNGVFADSHKGDHYVS